MKVDDAKDVRRGADGIGAGATQVAEHDILLGVAQRDDRGQVGQGLEPLEIDALQPVIQHTLRAIRRLVAFRRLDRADENILRTKVADLLEGRLFRPFTDGDHADDGSDAEDDAQRREQAAQLVQAKIFQAKEECFKKEVQHFDPSFQFVRCQSSLVTCPEVVDIRPLARNK